MPEKLGKKRLKSSVDNVQLSLGCDTHGCDTWNSGILSILELVSTIILHYDGLPSGLRFERARMVLEGHYDPHLIVPLKYYPAMTLLSASNIALRTRFR